MNKSKVNEPNPPKAPDVEEGTTAVSKLWIIKQIIEGEIVGMSKAPGKPLEVRIESLDDD